MLAVARAEGGDQRRWNDAIGGGDHGSARFQILGDDTIGPDLRVVSDLDGPEDFGARIDVHVVADAGELAGIGVAADRDVVEDEAVLADVRRSYTDVAGMDQAKCRLDV